MNLKDIAKFSYTKTVLSIDETIKFVKNLSKIDDDEEYEYDTLLDDLHRLRSMCYEAVNTKHDFWD